MKIKQKLWKRLKFSKDSPTKSTKSTANVVSNKKYDSSDTPFKECNSKEIEEKYGITLQMQHGILPATKIPGTDLIIEDILLLSYAFFDAPWEVSCVTICAKIDEILQEEKKAVGLLIKKANESPMCDSEEADHDMLIAFPSIAVVPIRQEDMHIKKSSNEYLCMKSLQGFSFQDIENDELDALVNKATEDVFFFRIVQMNVLHPSK